MQLNYKRFGLIIISIVITLCILIGIMVTVNPVKTHSIEQGQQEEHDSSDLVDIQNEVSEQQFKYLDVSDAKKTFEINEEVLKVFEAFESVICGEREFFLDNTKDKQDISFYATSKYKYYPSGYELLDVNDDGVPEMLLWVSYKEYDSIPLMVYYYNDEVYVYTHTHRGVRSLKLDGTAYFSNSAFESGHLRIQFHKGVEFTKILGHSVISMDDQSYFIEEREVSEYEYLRFVDVISKKETTTFNKISLKTTNQ